MSANDDLTQAASGFSVLLGGTKAAQLSLATPCSEWDVSQLIQHVLAGTDRFTSLLRSEDETEQLRVWPNGDPRIAFDDSFADFRTAISAPGALDGTYAHRVGDVDGHRLVLMRMNEFLVHSWDLAQATNQPSPFADSFAEVGLANAELILAERPREEGGTWSPSRNTPNGASAFDQLAAFCGRTIPTR
jgi:uncharacterized protein (TIGR03086 family)